MCVCFCVMFFLCVVLVCGCCRFVCVFLLFPVLVLFDVALFLLLSVLFALCVWFVLFCCLCVSIRCVLVSVCLFFFSFFFICLFPRFLFVCVCCWFVCMLLLFCVSPVVDVLCSVVVEWFDYFA